MNLKELPIPRTYPNLLKTYEAYYHGFYLDMVRMSNSNFLDYVDKYFDLLYFLAKFPGTENSIRAAIGVVCLHQFGYHDFKKLTAVFDRLIPQVDLEYIKFTSWCVGKLVHHPDNYEMHYASQLFSRVLDWTRMKGRRARPLAAAYMLESLSFNAGSIAVSFFPNFQIGIWSLVSFPSVLVIKGVAKAIASYTRAIIRYGRNELTEYMTFLSKVCMKLLFFDDPVRVYAALMLFEVLVNGFPNFFIPHLFELLTDISDAAEGKALLVQGGAYVVISCLSQVGPSTFIDTMADEHFAKTDELLLEFPFEVTRSLTMMCQFIPEFIGTKLDKMKEFAIILIDEEPDCAFKLLAAIIEYFGSKVLPIPNEIMLKLIQLPISEDFKDFFVALMKCDTNLSNEVQQALNNKIIKELKDGQKVIALNLVSKMPKELLFEHEKLLNAIWPLTVDKDIKTRSAVPTAIFNIGRCTELVTIQSISKRFCQLAIYDQSVRARCAILQALIDNADESLASPDFRTFYEIFINDDSSTVRELFYNLLVKLSRFNPMTIMALTRCAMLDTFFIIRNIPSIRKRAKTIRGLPILIKAAGRSIKAYSGGLMDIILNILGDYNSKAKFDNFLEEDAQTCILIGVVDSLTLLAPMDPEIVSKHASIIVPILCDIVLTTDHRKLRLFIFELFYVLLTAPASTLDYRIQIPQILTTCSQFLMTTHSRKTKMEILKVLGAIGIVELHQRPPPKGTQTPPNMDNDLARQFFNPSRDADCSLDDSLLLSPSTSEQYFACYTANALIDILKDDQLKEFYVETIRAVVEVLKHPKMFILTYFDMFVSRLLEILECSSDKEINLYLPLFSNLILNSTHNISPFLKRSLKLIHERFNDELSCVFIDLIIAFLTAVRDGFSPYASETICLLVVILDDKKTVDGLLCKKVLKAFAILGVYSADLLYLVIPQISDAIICEQTLPTVRIAALVTLTELAAQVDLLPFLGPIARSMEYCYISFQTPKTIKAAFQLLYTILKSLGVAFLVNAQPLLDFLKATNNETPELKELVYQVSQGKFGDGFHPLNVNKKPDPLPKIVEKPLSADSIISKAEDFERVGRNNERWLQSFILCVISNSPSPSIKTCTTIATSYYPLAKKLFNCAFLSCWQKMNLESRSSLTHVFEQLLKVSDEEDSINRSLLNVIVFMDKIEQPIGIPVFDLVSASVRSGSVSYAIRLMMNLLDAQPDDVQVINKLIDVLVQIGQWQNAIGVWRQSQMVSATLSRTEVLSKLGMWDQVEPVYREQYNNNHSFKAFSGLIESLASLARWKQLMDFHDDFEKLKVQQKQQLAPFFADAALHLSEWDKLHSALKYASDDSWRCCVLSALSALHYKDFESVKRITNQTFSLLASRPMTFWADNHQIHRETMLECQELIEVIEMNEWLTNPRKRDDIAEVWNQRLKTATRDFDLWFAVLANRVRVASVRDDALVQFFQMRSATLGKQIHLDAFNILYPDFNLETASDAQKLCHAIAEWNVGHNQIALSEVKKLTTQLQGNLLMRANVFYAQWLLETEGETFTNLKDAYTYLEATVKQIDDSTILRYGQKTEVSKILSNTHQRNDKTNNLILPTQISEELVMHVNQIDMIRKWSDVNAALINFDPENKVKYVVNAITALSRCAKLTPAFPDGVQMLNLFFENADNEIIFNETNDIIKNLPVKLLLQASPQIEIQMSHGNMKVREFVNELVFSLLEIHFHSLIYSLLVLKTSKNAARAKAATSILNKWNVKYPQICSEVNLIRSALLRAAVTWNEKIANKVSDTYDHFQRNNMSKVISTLKSILAMVSKPVCEMHDQFIKQHSRNLSMLDQILKAYSPDNQSSVTQLTKWCKTMQDNLGEEIKRTRIIQLSAISRELTEKDDFILAVPGTYKPNEPINHIKYFVGQFSVYMSKQQPKDVVIKGEDGIFYQYLLKGHEDLRLDERIMQFFRMVNSLLLKDSSLNSHPIQTVYVVPLSISHGLVQWATGTDTLRAIIEQYRRLHSRDPLEEYMLSDDFGNGAYDFLLPIQKVQILERIFHEIPDTDLANFFWLKAPSADVWMKQVQTYSISIAITSIVGYIIGLGDRHPSNLLFDRNTGKVVHIDFGDCFERASHRKYLPEVVPFRLTRMMVKALGAGGVEGEFKTSFVNMANLLRANKQVLEMVLAIFVHEPLIDPDYADDGASDNEKNYPMSPFTLKMSALSEDTSPVNNSDDYHDTFTSSEEMRIRIRQKITGSCCIEGTTPLSAEEQATKLISEATDLYTLGKMYSGWCPFW
ncbi:PIKK family atypical protein kinase [Tritrichomonas foetus]|uniref:Serine/threonine-protein kinase TOR n=1 Tax=Tritrichomonas foetus TaxID=1144522 RepID=A0A1J4KGP2_9EUKA|nr:PIKK family atypical protein kinase [Tritrichomonas foetus]|eukprot:OHT10537.1 PIKK family atypical protein kinase [Tritrichomonas foetus]